MDDSRLNQSAPAPAVDDEEQDIDWMELFKKLWAQRRWLIKVAIIGAVLGVIVALGKTHTYTVTVTLSPEMGSDTKNSSGLASLASSFLGGSMSATTDALNATLSSDIVASTPFLLDLSEIRVQTLDGETDTTLCGYLDERHGNIIGLILHSPGLLMKAIKDLFREEIIPEDNGGRGPIFLTEEQSQMIEMMKEELITADVDKKTAITTISVTMTDPKVSAIVADSAVSMLQRHIINYRIAKAKEDCNYLETLCDERRVEYYDVQTKYAQYVDANRNIALQSVRIEQERLQNDMSLAFQIYSQVSQQLQMARAKIQEAKPVFAVIEPAVVPLHPTDMSRKIIVILVIFLFVAGGSAWILWGQDYLDLFKAKIREVRDAEHNAQAVDPASEPKVEG